MDALESRFVLSSVTAGVEQGVLVIKGTEGDDRIVVRSSWIGMRVRPRTPELIQVVGVGDFAASQVRLIVVDAGAGNDLVVLDLRPVGQAPQIYGGAGNDILRGRRMGADVLVGGSGNDILEGRGGRDSFDPGPGRNLVNGRPRVVAEPPASVPTTPVTPTPTPVPTPPNAPGWVLIPQDPVPSINITAWIVRIYQLTNQERRKAGLNELTINPTLVRLAQLQADQMVRYGKMQHDIPEAAYPDMRSRADAVGYRLEWLGENLAYNYGDADSVVAGWMMSTGHRENMLFEPFTEMGVAIGLDAAGRPYIALELGRPA
jgi:uncharacterized protein YkwD